MKGFVGCCLLRSLFLLLALSALVLIPACSKDSTGPKDDDDDFTPPDLSTPDLLVEAVRQAFVTMDAELYANLLYDGSDTGRGAFASFVFYFSEGLDIWGQELPTDQNYEDEMANITRMFSGDPGDGPNGQEIPGIASIDLVLTLSQTWSNPPNPDDVEGDPYPEGTKRAIFETDMTIMLKGTLPPPLNEDIIGFVVQDQLEFHVIPVLVGQGTADAHTEYRLWKWQDLVSFGGPRTEEITWSAVKACYPESKPAI